MSAERFENKRVAVLNKSIDTGKVTNALAQEYQTLFFSLQAMQLKVLTNVKFIEIQ